MKQDNFIFSTSVLAWPLFFVLFIWTIHVLEIIFPGNFIHYGILPRTISGIKGILFSPFLHANWEHLYNNSITLFVLLAALRYFYRNESLKVVLFGILLSGIGTWLLGRTSYHIGASGLIYVLASFIFFEGFQTKYYRLIALSFFIVFFYGGMIWYIFPSAETQISWEGHLSGFISGFILSRIIKSHTYQKPITYNWQEPNFDPSTDDFMQHFDEKGNFAPKPNPETIQPVEESNNNTYFNYIYKENQNKTNL